MPNRNWLYPILFAGALSFSLSPSLLAETDSLPTKPVKATPPVKSSPAPSAVAASSAPATTETPSTYTVAEGDTLWDLSHKFNCSVKQIKTLNNLKKNALKPGQVIKIPTAKTKDKEPAPTATPAAKPSTSNKPAVKAAKPAASVTPTSPSLSPKAGVKATTSTVASIPPKAASAEKLHPRAQPVQDFDIPASTFASCPIPPNASDADEIPSPAPIPAPVIPETPSTASTTPATRKENTISSSASVINEIREMPVLTGATTGFATARQFAKPDRPSSSTPSSKSSAARDPFFATTANEWGNRFFQVARDLGNRDIDYNDSWRPPGEPRSWAMDCSNTARYIYKAAANIQLPRTASDQYYYLHLQKKAWDVPQASNGFADVNFLKDNLKPGDLLFWENTYKPERQPPITHVMVFLGKNDKGQWVMAGSQTGRGGEHNRRHGGPDIYVFNPTQPCGGYTTWLGMVHHQGRFCAYGRPLEADKAKLAVAAND